MDKPGYRADGNCRACMVSIEGERVLASFSCIRKPTEGMKVLTKMKDQLNQEKNGSRAFSYRSTKQKTVMILIPISGNIASSIDVEKK